MTAPLNGDQFPDALERQSDEVLNHLHGNLSRGLDLITDHYLAGTLHDKPANDKKANPPTAGGWLTLGLHKNISHILAKRENERR